MRKILLLLSIAFMAINAKSQIKGYTVEALDYIILQGDTIRTNAPSDGEYIKMISGVWTNGSGGAGTASVDSLIWNIYNGYLGWYIGGSVQDYISLDGRYIEIADSSISYVTPTELDNAALTAQTVVYNISLPSAGSVAARVSAATEGTDYPTGWVLAAGSSSIDLDIQHSLGRRVANVTVWAVTGTQEQMLFNTAAFNGLITDDDNNLRIQSLATISKDIKIYITFAQ